jgi:hypothetical protein
VLADDRAVAVVLRNSKIQPARSKGVLPIDGAMMSL